MNKTSTISARIDPQLKTRAEHIFKRLGLTSSQAITIFYKQVELQQGLPFPVQLPNAETQQALNDARRRRDLDSFDNIDDLMDDLRDG